MPPKHKVSGQPQRSIGIPQRDWAKRLPLAKAMSRAREYRVTGQMVVLEAYRLGLEILERRFKR